MVLYYNLVKGNAVVYGNLIDNECGNKALSPRSMILDFERRDKYTVFIKMNVFFFLEIFYITEKNALTIIFNGGLW